MLCPSQSPDLNPTAELWEILECCVKPFSNYKTESFCLSCKREGAHTAQLISDQVYKIIPFGEIQDWILLPQDYEKFLQEVTVGQTAADTWCLCKTEWIRNKEGCY